MNYALTFPFMLLLASPSCAGDTMLLPVQSASTEPDPVNSSNFQVHVHLTEEGRTRFGVFTTEHVGDKIKVLTNAKAVSSSMRILTPITGGVLVLNSVPSNEAKRIAEEISNSSAAFGVVLLP